MKILFINAYFYPEIFASSHLEQDILYKLIRAGHEVTLICPTPSRGISKEVIKKYKHIKKETVNEVKIQRFWTPREGKHPLCRALRYFWTNIRANQIARKYRDTDVIYANSTPPTQGLFVGKLAKKMGVPFVYSLQDLFPDTLLSSGLMRRKGLLYRIGLRVEKKTYERATRIIVISETMNGILLEKGVPEDKLLTVSNWVNTKRVAPIPKEENPLFEELGVDKKKFIAVYAGNLGITQGTRVIVKAARKLKDNGNIFFAVFGAGSDYEKCEEYIRQNGLTNIRMFPLQPIERVSEVYSMGNVALITCRKGVSETAMPSKLWCIMACNVPIIASFDTHGELADILDAAEAGTCVEPEDVDALAQAIEQAYRDSLATRNACTLNCRNYVITHASSKKCAVQYVECMENAAKDNKPQRVLPAT